MFLQMNCTRRRYRKTLRCVCLGRQERKNLNLITRLAKELEEEWDMIQVKIKIELSLGKISGAKKEHITYLELKKCWHICLLETVEKILLCEF